MGKKTGLSVDELGNPYDYIVVIDAGSKGSRAHLYRASQFNGDSTVSQKSTNADDDSDSDSEEEDGDKQGGKKWADVNDVENSRVMDYPAIELVRRKKVKPGIAEFVNNPKKLGSKYVGKLLDDMEKYVPKDQVSRTPVFLHATGGMRLLRPEEQEVILTQICTYIQKHSNFYLPDCQSHVNSITGETEGLYSWIGLNYKYGAFSPSVEDKSTYGALDMGGVSSQISFEPSNVKEEHTDFLFKVLLDYQDSEKESKSEYQVFTQSFLGGINQAHLKYDEGLVQKNILTDPCLPKGYVKAVTTKEGEKVDIEGSSDFTECLKTLYDVLSEISVDKYCDPTDSMTATSCLLSDSLPKMEFSVKKFVGINEFYSNLKEFLNYKDSYERARKICSYSYTDILQEKELTEDEKDKENSSEICFKAAWIINVLHQGVGFPRYGIDEVSDAETLPSSSIMPDFTVFDGFSWTLGRAVLYTYYETAARLQNETEPMVGYYEPSSKVFVSGGEALGVAARPAYIVDYYSEAADDDHDNHDDEKDDDDWDDVQDHRFWGSLSFLLILLIVVYLLLGKTKRQSIVDAVKQIIATRFRGGPATYAPVDVENDDLELGIHEIEEGGEQEEEEDPGVGRRRRSDSFEIE